MIRFICKEIRTCPDGSIIKTEMKSFLDILRLEEWLKKIDLKFKDYVDRSLIGCEIIDVQETDVQD